MFLFSGKYININKVLLLKEGCMDIIVFEFNPFNVEDTTVTEDRLFSSLDELASIARNSAYSSNIVEYTWIYKSPDDGTFGYSGSKNKIFFNIDNYAELKKYVDALDNESKRLDSKLAPFESYFGYCGKCYDCLLSDDDKIVGSESLFEEKCFYDLVLGSIAKHFIPEIYQNLNKIFDSNMNPFRLTLKRTTALNMPINTFLALKDGFVGFLEEKGLRKENYEKLFSLIENMFFRKEYTRSFTVGDFEKYSKEFRKICIDVAEDFMKNQILFADTIRDDLYLSDSVNGDLECLSLIYTTFESVDFLRNTFTEIEDFNPDIDGIEKLKIQFVQLGERKKGLESYIGNLRDSALEHKKGMYNKAINEVNRQLNSFYKHYRSMTAENVDAVFHLLLEHDRRRKTVAEIQTFEDMRSFVNDAVFKELWQGDSLNKRHYKAISRLFRKKEIQGLENDVLKMIGDVSTGQFQHDAGYFKSMNSDEVSAVSYVLSQYREECGAIASILTYKDLDNFIDSDAFKEEWHSSAENEEMYRAVSKLFKKRNSNVNQDEDIVNIISAVVSEGSSSLNARDEALERLDVFDRATRWELEEFESLFPKLLGISSYYSELEDINNQYSEITSSIDAKKKSVSDFALKIQKAIEVMDSKKIEVTEFSEGVTPNFSRVQLYELSMMLNN